MKFLCTKVKPAWLTLPSNREKVFTEGLKIREPFIGIEIKEVPTTHEEKFKLQKAIEKLFTKNKNAFPVKLIDL